MIYIRNESTGTSDKFEFPEGMNVREDMIVGQFFIVNKKQYHIHSIIYDYDKQEKIVQVLLMPWNL